MELKDFFQIESYRRFSNTKNFYLIMTGGDTNAAHLLHRIIRSYLPNRNGYRKLRVLRDGYLWLAKPDRYWKRKIGLNPKQAKRAREILVKKNLIITQVFGFIGSPVMHYRPDITGFLSALAAAINGQNASLNQVSDEDISLFAAHLEIQRDDLIEPEGSPIALCFQLTSIYYEGN